MIPLQRIDLGLPALLEFQGPDAVRFLNGQVTQDVRKVVGADAVLPGCVTDAKGKLQFRIGITEISNGILWIIGGAESAELLEGRITRYLIADDVEVSDLTGRYALVHFTGEVKGLPEGVIVKKSTRYGIPGIDCLVPTDQEIQLPEIPKLEGEALEHFRIWQGVPEWDVDLKEGQLPPEAGLEASDISYQKGCYIGQEVISRIKSAGKVNKKLTKLWVSEALTQPSAIFSEDGSTAGEITSISPEITDGKRAALGYIKRSSEDEVAFFSDLDRKASVTRR